VDFAIVVAEIKMITEHSAVGKNKNNVDEIQDVEWDCLSSAYE
jgi:hypothetical protein